MPHNGEIEVRVLDIPVVLCGELETGRIFAAPTWTPNWDDADDVHRWVHAFAEIDIRA